MKSKIRVDFKGLEGAGPQAFEPVIRIELQDSEDVRDGLLKAFFEKLGTESNWLNVDFWQITPEGGFPTKTITLTPVTPEELDGMRSIITERLNMVNKGG